MLACAFVFAPSSALPSPGVIASRDAVVVQEKQEGMSFHLYLHLYVWLG
jgi:hypothetical protein